MATLQVKNGQKERKTALGKKWMGFDAFPTDVRKQLIFMGLRERPHLSVAFILPEGPWT